MPTNTNTRSHMKATLVRFGPELYEDLRAEAQLAGVSIAEYVREAVVARMAYTAGRRGDASYGQAAPTAAAAARAESVKVREESTAVRAEGRQALGQSRKVV